MLILSNDLLASLIFPCFAMRGTQSKSIHKMDLETIGNSTDILYSIPLEKVEVSLEQSC